MESSSISNFPNPTSYTVIFMHDTCNMNQMIFDSDVRNQNGFKNKFCQRSKAILFVYPVQSQTNVSTSNYLLVIKQTQTLVLVIKYITSFLFI